jgi:hypothetical protein
MPASFSITLKFEFWVYNFNTHVIKWKSLHTVHINTRHLSVKALCFKPEGRGFEIRWGEWIVSIYLILPATLDPGVYSATNRNKYQKQKQMLALHFAHKTLII